MLLTARGENLALVDIAMAQRWLMSRRMREALHGGRIASRPLLLPESMVVTEATADRVEASRPVLETLGFGLHRTAPAAIVVRELPIPLSDLDPRLVVRELLAVLAELAPRPRATAPEGGERSVARRVCDDLVQRLGDYLSGEVGGHGCEGLLSELERAWDGSEPPEQSPVWVEVSPQRLRRFFDELVQGR